jgi:SAM-dependent MidA family methyltransferase
VTPLEEELRERIRSSGPLPFRDFMAACLYDPRHGYYGGGEVRVGRAGHFLTSPELDPGFGELWCRAFFGLWEASGAPEGFTIVELGPGEGGFASAVLAAASPPFASALRYVLVEPHRAAAQRQRERLGGDRRTRWTARLPDRVSTGVVFANEVLDNLPVHLLERRGGRVLEVHVSASETGLREVLLAPTRPELEARGRGLGEGRRMVVGLEAERLAAEAAAAVERGAVVFVDYGHDMGAKRDGTLVSYSGASADTSILKKPGRRDITAHVDWRALETSLTRSGLALGPRTTQREVLRGLGAEELDHTLQARHREALAVGRGAEAVRALSRRHALAALLDPGGLGGLEVVWGTRGVEGWAPPHWAARTVSKETRQAGGELRRD